MSAREKAKREWEQQKREEREQRESEENSEETSSETESTETEKMSENTVEDLQITWTGGHQYRVFSPKGETGAGNFYEVDLSEGTCTCDFAEYNGHEENSKGCKHLNKAVMVAPAHPDTDQRITMAHIELVQSALSIMDDARDTVQSAQIAHREADIAADHVQEMEAKKTSAEAHQAEADLDPDAKAGKLQTAYDDVVEDMQVKAGLEYIWIQTGKDTPDNLPVTGKPDTFETLLKNADQVEYIHDDHDLADERPGKWWKNAIHPTEVDSYIEEVLR